MRLHATAAGADRDPSLLDQLPRLALRRQRLDQQLERSRRASVSVPSRRAAGASLCHSARPASVSVAGHGIALAGAF